MSILGFASEGPGYAFGAAGTFERPPDFLSIDLVVLVEVEVDEVLQRSMNVRIATFRDLHPL